MAIIYPKKMDDKINSAEKKMYNIFKQCLGKHDICYHNYNIEEKETDFKILLPGEGIVVVEVKGWNGTNIIDVTDNDTIKYRNAEGIEEIYHSPLKQARRYSFSLANEIKSKLNLSIKVASLVCYPFMSEATFNQKGLHIVSSREITILKDDLEDIHQFNYILKRKAAQYKCNGIDEFNRDAYLKVRSIYEKEGDIEESTELSTRQIKRAFATKRYSTLAYVPKGISQEIFEDRVERYYYNWLSGTKIIMILSSESQREYIYKFFEHKLSDEIDYLNKYKQFRFYDKSKNAYKDRVFNFEMHIGNFQIPDIEIIDGKGIDAYKEELIILDRETNFNLKQYTIEHHKENVNILVKAGAGTGKTYSMVARVGYLYYKMNYTPEDLINGIVMITFTNEAAQNMKIRLKEYFTNMAILTERLEYLRVMENISRMKISTIHSLSKKIIEQYSKYLGMGRSVSIKSGVYERRQEIQRTLDAYIRDNDVYRRLFLKVKKYELLNAIEEIMDELEKKNINLEKGYIFDSCSHEPDIMELIKVVATDVQKSMLENNINDSEVHLSNLMVYLDVLVGELEKQEIIKEKVDFVFVDEFQDTDDIQIKLLQRFYEIFQFKFFVVGDTKQSIYRFRGAEDKAFTKLKEGMSDWKSPDLRLNKNYRSDEELLNKFNTLFTKWNKQNILQYKDVDGEDCDRLIGVKKDSAINNHIECVQYRENELREQLISVLNEKIEELNKKYAGKNETGKIAILTRGNEDINKVKELCSGHIKIDTDKAQNLYQLAPTKDLYYLILALQFNTTPKYLYALSQTSYSRGITNKVVYQSKETPERIPNDFRSNKIIPKWSEYLKELRDRPVLRVIRDIIEDTKPWNRYSLAFPEDERESRRKYYKINLDILIEDIVQSGNEDYITINKLENYLYIKIFANQHQDERSVELKSTEHEIKCLTVHKSKGLEYDHIILPFTQEPMTMVGSNKIIITHEKIFVRLKINNKIIITTDNFNKQIKQEKIDLVKEEARILYVALTRAKDTVTWMQQIDKKPNKKKESWKLLLEGGEI